MLALLLAQAVYAATLPGIPLPFDVDAQGRWVLGEELPEAVAAAGAQPGWVLTAVDDFLLDDPVTIQRAVAAGPGRDVRLRFLMVSQEDDGTAQGDDEPAEVILVLRRAELVQAEQLGILQWPDGFAVPARAWEDNPYGNPRLTDANGAGWSLDPASGALTRAGKGTGLEWAIPDVFWELSSAAWVVDRADSVTELPPAEVRDAFTSAGRIRSFQGRSGDHLLLAGDDGIEVLVVTWPRGTPSLSTCTARVPETCLASGKQIMQDLGDRPSAMDEALRHFTMACAEGVYRGCYEAVALEHPPLTEQAGECVEGELASCNTVAKDRLAAAQGVPSDLVIGLLEYACEQEGSGSLGERLRRLEDVGAGCMLLSEAYDQRKMPDRALLNLDQACVLGRADACDMAQERRYQAFAARTVSECQDEVTPIAAACVDLGRLLQAEPSISTDLDEFDAFLRGCTLGAAEGCEALGDYVDRWGVDHERVVKAESDLRQSCKLGEQQACLGAAHLLVRHEPRSDAYAKALQLFDGACDNGLADACIGGAEQRRIGHARKVDAPEQLDMWGSACTLHSAPGCAGLGERHERKKKEWPDAYTAWNTACELGDAHSCSQLGQLVSRRHDPQWEGEQPRPFYLERGCDNNDPAGCYWLAEDTLPRAGEPPEATYLLLAKSCEGKYGDGCARLAKVHLDRRTSFDAEISARHLDTACAHGHYDSCRILGGMYQRGKGVERDRQKANELLDRFRLNAPRTHLRIGAQAGIAAGVGLEAEGVLPIPVGPALTVAGAYSYLPGAGSVLVQIEGDLSPEEAPDLTYVGVSSRLFLNHQARGVFGAAGVHQLTASGGSIGEDRVRTGFSARMGFRTDRKRIYTGVEVGMGTYGEVRIRDFDEDAKKNDKFPLILPTFAISVGLALL